MKTPRCAWLPALVGLLAAIRLAADVVGGDETESPDGPTTGGRNAAIRPHGEAMAVWRGLTEGEKLAGWTVDCIEVASDGILRVWVGKPGVRWAAEIRRPGRSPGPPPRSTDEFDLYYGNLQPEDAKLDPAEALAVLDSLAQRIRGTDGGS